MATVLDLPLPGIDGLSAPLGQLMQATSALAAQDPTELPGLQALTETQVLLAELDRLKLVALRRIADVDKRGLAELDGSPSTTTWIAQQQTGMRRSDVALARRLDRFPLLAESVFDGLSVDAAQRVATGLTTLRPHVDRPDALIDGQPSEPVVRAVICNGVLSLICEARGGVADDDLRLARWQHELAGIAWRPASELARLEAAFVFLAVHVEPGLLGPALEQLVAACLPQQLEDHADRAHLDRELQLTRNYGGAGWSISGQLDDECGELLHAALTAQLAVDPDNVSDTTAWAEHHNAASTADDLSGLCGGPGAPRSVRQRRHDALKLALRTLLDAGALGRRDRQAPHIAVTIGLDALHAAPGALPGRGASGAPLRLSLVRRWMCDSYITRFVLSLGGRVLEASHTERTLKPHERRAKRLETGGRCQGAGCTRGPGDVLIPHHATPWAVVGTTSLADTALLCEQTHHDVHSGGKTIRLKDGRYLNANGWVDAPRP